MLALGSSQKRRQRKRSNFYQPRQAKVSVISELPHRHRRSQSRACSRYSAQSIPKCKNLSLRVRHT